MSIALGSGNECHVSVASDANDRFHAVWRQEAQNGKSRVVYALFNGSAWSTPAPIADDGATSQFFPSIAVADKDTLWMVWTESADKASFAEDDPIRRSVVASHKDADGSWSMPAPLNDHPTSSIYVSLSLTAINPNQPIDAF